MCKRSRREARSYGFIRNQRAAVAWRPARRHTTKVCESSLHRRITIRAWASGGVQPDRAPEPSDRYSRCIRDTGSANVRPAARQVYRVALASEGPWCSPYRGQAAIIGMRRSSISALWGLLEVLDRSVQPFGVDLLHHRLLGFVRAPYAGLPRRPCSFGSRLVSLIHDPALHGDYGTTVVVLRDDGA
jgi:hypothetical protein